MFKKGNIVVDLKGITSVIVAAILSGLIAFAVTTERLDGHIDNAYIHKDIAELEETFVRKDVQAEQLKAINDKLDNIIAELGIE